MNKTMIWILALLLTLAVAAPTPAAEHHDSNRGYDMAERDRGNPSQHDRNRDRNQRYQSKHNRDRDRLQSPARNYEYYDRRHDRNYGYRHPENRPRGYYPMPFGARRFDHSYRNRNHDYHYEGHWNSWNNWERYKRMYPDRFRHGGYYREGVHLFYRYCDPVGSCFFFSIGR